MSTLTENLKLHTWLESDVVDFEQLNENFEKLDTMVMCIESGTAPAYYTGGVLDSEPVWRYKKYSDGTVEMSAKFEYTNLKCNGGGGDGSPYYSGDSTISLPQTFTLASVYDVQMHMASNTFGWVSDITGQSVIDKVMFRAFSLYEETTEEYKQVFINVKGVLA